MARRPQKSRAKKRVAAPPAPAKQAAPAKIFLLYKEVGASHVFTATGFPGFYIASAEIDDAFGYLARALGEHVSHVSGRQVEYDLGVTLNDFKANLKAGGILPNHLIEARRDGSGGNARVRVKELEPA